MRCPYKGLSPFSKEDQEFFAGREREIDLVVLKLYSSHLTILYGESGVGKTSLLVAGVMPKLDKEDRVAAILFREWQRPDFDVHLRTEILKSLLEKINRLSSPSTPLAFDAFIEKFCQSLELKTCDALNSLPLGYFLKKCSEAFYGRVFFVFDQFEEYIYYNPLKEKGDYFDAELATVINDKDVPASFLFSLREDGLGKLDRMRPRIPNLLGNVIKLDHLDKAGAEEAIKKPLAVFNQKSKVKVAVAPELVSVLLEQANADRIELDGQGEAAEQKPDLSDRGIRYKALALQAVLTLLWEKEVGPEANPAQITISRPALTELARGRKAKEDEVRFLVRTYFDQRLQRLDGKLRANAAKILPFLVRPGGQKKARSAKTLSEESTIPEKEVQATLDRLKSEPLSLVRTISDGGNPLYELYHDVMAFAVQDWSTREQHLADEKRLKRKWLITGALTTGFVAILIYVGYTLEKSARVDESNKRMHTRSLTDESLMRLNSRNLESDPGLALRVAVDNVAYCRKHGSVISPETFLALWLATKLNTLQNPQLLKELLKEPFVTQERSLLEYKIPSVRGRSYFVTVSNPEREITFCSLEDGSHNLLKPGAAVREVGINESEGLFGVTLDGGGVRTWNFRLQETKPIDPTNLTKSLKFNGQNAFQSNFSVKPIQKDASYEALLAKCFFDAISGIPSAHPVGPDDGAAKWMEEESLTTRVDEIIDDLLKDTGAQGIGIDGAIEQMKDLIEPKDHPLQLGSVPAKVLAALLLNRADRESSSQGGSAKMADTYRNFAKQIDKKTFDDADRARREAQKQSKGMPAQEIVPEAQKAIKQGSDYAAGGNLKEAMNSFNQAIGADPRLQGNLDPEVEVGKYFPPIIPDAADKIWEGQQSLENKQLPEARSSFEKAIELDSRVKDLLKKEYPQVFGGDETNK
ncbi:MAG: hypothetical protein C5B58_02910 [Acidobacteria bacterium]|nr:MAG: hypothetical protein C5B58_02910 [Acidobacteriota bacterium]